MLHQINLNQINQINLCDSKHMQISSTRTDNKSDSEKRYFRIEVYLNLSNIPAKTRFTRST